MENHIHPIFEKLVLRKERELFLNQHSVVFWFTGLSGSGKSTIARGVERALFKEGFFIQVLDGDNLRNGLCSNLSFTLEGRKENIRRVAEVAKLYTQSGVITLCSFISPTSEIRMIAKKVVGKKDFKQIYIDTPLEVCESRDVKGLYKKARKGTIKGFTGIDSPYEAPSSPDLVIKTINSSVEECVQQVVTFVKSECQIS